MTTAKVSHRPIYERYERAQRRADARQARKPRAFTPRPVDHSEEASILMAKQGLLVAEELTTKARERLFAELHVLGWTDLQMAEHTRTTLYTTARIRDRLGLSPNRPHAEGMTA
jgi:hypothetical protein